MQTEIEGVTKSTNKNRNMIVNETWVACTFNENALTLVNLQLKVLEGWNHFHCLAFAAALQWVYLVVFSGTGVCTLFELNAIAVADATKNLSGGSRLCRIRNEFVGETCL